MDELVMTGELFAQSDEQSFIIATVVNLNQNGLQLMAGGASEPMKKYYRYLNTGSSFNRGDRVLAVKVSGTYVVLGKISS